jgi:hypothetical protein
MDYQTWVDTQFIPRVTALLEGLKSNVGNAGVSGIKVEPVDDGGDMRYRITASKGGRTFIAYIELTAAGVIDEQMALQLTLWVEGNGNQINTSYQVGPPVRYDSESSFEFLNTKLTQLENASTGEMLSAAKSFLRV